MSTSHESDSENAPQHLKIPPEWAARPGHAPVRAVVYAPSERREWILRALDMRAGEIEFARSLEEVAGAELALVSHQCLQEEPDVLRRGGPDPLWVVIDAPQRSRAAWLNAGADIAAGPETAATELGAAIEALMRRARTERDRSPLTGLPGNRWLRRHIVAMLEQGETVSLTVADIDDFKEYNDRCGHLAGDALITLLADALRDVTEPLDAFLAHVGGDDFCVVCRPGDAGRIARDAEAEFARRCAESVSVTVVSTTVTPDEAERLESAFERLAALRLAARSAEQDG